MRIFDSDGNGYLDFKEFLLAVDIATCQTEASKLAWVFKLYDVDNDGIIDVHEMAFIMETMDCLESGGGGSKNKNNPSVSDSSTNFTKKNCENVAADIEDVMTCTTPLERAQNLFDCLDHKNENTLTKEEFIAGKILLLNLNHHYEFSLIFYLDAVENISKWLSSIVIKHKKNNFRISGKKCVISKTRCFRPATEN